MRIFHFKNDFLQKIKLEILDFNVKMAEKYWNLTNFAPSKIFIFENHIFILIECFGEQKYSKKISQEEQ